MVPLGGLHSRRFSCVFVSSCKLSGIVPASCVVINEIIRPVGKELWAQQL